MLNLKLVNGKKEINSSVSPELKTILTEYLLSTTSNLSEVVAALNLLFDLYGIYLIPWYMEFSEKQVFECIKDKKIRARAKNQILRFYSFLIDKNYVSFNYLTSRILAYSSFIRLINEGYRVINSNQKDKNFQSNKWIIEIDSKVYSLNFEAIKGIYTKKYLKEYLFDDFGPQLSTKFSRFRYYANLLNRIDDLPKLQIEYKTITDIKDDLKNKGNSDPSIHIELSSDKNFCEFLKVNNYAEINNVTLNHFDHVNVKSKGFTDYYSASEMEIILNRYKEIANTTSNAQSKLIYELHYIILLLLVNTPMRTKTICNLKISDLKHDNGNIWYYETQSKIYEVTKYNLTNEQVNLHKKVIELTADIRQNAGIYSDYLFIYSRKRGRSVIPVDSESITITFGKVCNKLKIRNLGISGIRNRFMNKITSKLDGASDKALLQAVSAHSLNVHYNNYYHKDIDRIALEMYGVNIGEVELKCIIKKDTNFNKNMESVVMNGLGVCTNKHCSDMSNYECFLCKNFVTTPSNIPFFVTTINELDKKIYDETNEHEKEFLVAKKRVLVKILFELNSGDNANEK